MSRLLTLFSLILTIFSSSIYAQNEMTLKGADGTVINAKVSGDQIKDNTGKPVPDGIYIQPDQSIVHVENGIVLKVQSMKILKNTATNADAKPQLPELNPPVQANNNQQIKINQTQQQKTINPNITSQPTQPSAGQ